MLDIGSRDPACLESMIFLKVGYVIVFLEGINDTVDGRNPAPVDMVNIILFTGFYTSQVVQDFFHNSIVA